MLYVYSFNKKSNLKNQLFEDTKNINKFRR